MPISKQEILYIVFDLFSSDISHLSKKGIGYLFSKKPSILLKVMRLVFMIAGVFPYSHPKKVPNGAYTQSSPLNEICIQRSLNTSGLKSSFAESLVTVDFDLQENTSTFSPGSREISLFLSV